VEGRRGPQSDHVDEGLSRMGFDAPDADDREAHARGGKRGDEGHAWPGRGGGRPSSGFRASAFGLLDSGILPVPDSASAR
jgi:hypothetical protein